MGEVPQCAHWGGEGKTLDILSVSLILKELWVTLSGSAVTVAASKL